jgi:aminoglycoside phosphotransferase (APT) family kinase protein
VSNAALGIGELSSLREYLVGAGEQVVGDLRSTLITGGRSNLTYELADDVRRWVLRRPPRGGLTPTAHDMGREYRVTRALRTSGVPVARTVGLNEDTSLLGAPFVIVDFVDGTTIRSADDLDRLTDEQLNATVKSMVQVLATLHSVDYVAVGLEAFGRPDGYAQRQLRRWSGQWDRVRPGFLRDADSLLESLKDAAPTSGRAAIVHGDFRMDNTIVDVSAPAPIKALVDWELSTIGDPVSDVAMMCAYRHPGLNDVLGVEAAWTSDRLPAADDLAALYENAAGTLLTHWDFFLALAFYKLAVIAQGIDFRLRAGAAASEGSEKAGDAVPSFLSAGLRVMGR